MKKIIRIILCFCLLLSASINVFAENSLAMVIQIQAASDAVYVFTKIPNSQNATGYTSNAEITFNGETSLPVQTESFQKMIGNTAGNTYLLLIDISRTMSDNESQINDCVKALMENLPQNADVAISTFGNTYQPQQEFTQDRKTVEKAVEQLTYNDEHTNLYSAIVDANKSFESRTSHMPELRNMILLSDGINDAENSMTKEDALQAISSPQVMIHSISFKSEQGESGDALADFSNKTGGTYIDLKNDSRSFENCAKDIAQTADDLYIAKYGVSNISNQEGSCIVRQTIYSDQDEIFECSGTLALANSESQNHSGSLSEPQNAPAEAVPAGQNFLVFWIILIAVFIVIGGLIIFFIHRSRPLEKKKEKSNTINSGIFIKIEIINGNYKGQSDSFILENELIIGRNSKCDIPFEDKEVSDKNSRIFIQNDFIYIEDLNSTNGTALANMKIFAPNRLRSGDIVSIGKVQIRFKF